MPSPKAYKKNQTHINPLRTYHMQLHTAQINTFLTKTPSTSTNTHNTEQLKRKPSTPHEKKRTRKRWKSWSNRKNSATQSHSAKMRRTTVKLHENRKRIRLSVSRVMKLSRCRRQTEWRRQASRRAAGFSRTRSTIRNSAENEVKEFGGSNFSPENLNFILTF